MIGNLTKTFPGWEGGKLEELLSCFIHSKMGYTSLLRESSGSTPKGVRVKHRKVSGVEHRKVSGVKHRKASRFYLVFVLG